MAGDNLETIHLRSSTGHRKYLTPDERRRFLNATKSLAERRRRFCEVLFYTGCRISEAYQLTADRLDPNESVIIFETLKLRKRGVYRAVPVPQEWLRTIVSPSCTGSLWGFSLKTGYRVVKQTMLLAGIEGEHASPKGLRHGFGIVHGQNKTNPRLLQRWMGHSSLDTTMIYLDAQGDEERNAAKVAW
jgi:integrase